MKIILAGGGTLGSVSPLIAIRQSLKEKDDNLQTLFVGTKDGPEKAFIERYKIPYKSILSGKLRRYFSLLNVIDVIKIILAIFQSFCLLIRFKPDFIISAGSFVAVPVIWASKSFKTKVILYQSDLKVGLANKLCQKGADYIFTAFLETVAQFPKGKTDVVGSVLRDEINKKVGWRQSTFSKNRRNIMILGGGTGSESINQVIKKSINQLSDFKIVHVTGKGKGIDIQEENYQSFELLTDDYYQKIAESDLVISRAGVSTLMELSYLSKPTVLIPLPDSAQIQNADYLCQRKAAVCLEQKELTSTMLIKKINELINNHRQLKNLSENIYKVLQHQGEEKIAQKIYELR